ncbi:DUF1990 domain-containing protein [Spongiactinospora sp. TRM90649]|uniref:DUF1990 family protein n=1 Tax=Spongiactinospora sp. TRM90649 TaxID=3031114 RepID=UPI0023FA0844|nr:DUF1990 domain-containing protein [Spongiactinospora sp. TRM90649]MDF5755304.1 DUF1990 domain-containing protein [Spongiactinospora sp. TRM90649]
MSEFTYPEVGATREGPLPDGYAHVRYRAPLAPGTSLEDAADALFGWRVHRRLLLRPIASAPAAAPGVVVICLLGVVRVPCRVVWAVREDDRAGYAYGTLPGHPESGEESFVLERDGDGTVWLTVTAFARPARWYTRLGAPLLPLVIAAFTRLYAIALRAEARPS